MRDAGRVATSAEREANGTPSGYAWWVVRFAALTLFLAAMVPGILSLASAESAITAEYRIVDLGTLPGGATSTAYGINNAGQIVGESDDADGSTFHAALWEDGVAIGLGHRGGPTNFSVALSINEQGEIVGYGRLPFTPDTRALLWSNGTMTDIHMPRAYGINERTQVSGGSNPSPSSRALLWEAGIVTDLGAYGGQAYDVNNLRQVVGGYRPCCPYGPHAFVWENGVLTDLGSGTATAINDAGQIVGGSSLWENGTRTDLGMLGGFTLAYDINNAGQVVGTSQNGSGSWHAFFWEGGVMTDLGTLPEGSESVAYGINDEGDIVGKSGTADGHVHAVLWTTANHDVAVVSASAEPRVAMVGTPITITATVENQGNRRETFEVRAFADSVLVGTETIADLAPGASTTVSLIWDTSDASPWLYEITVEAGPVPYESDLEDNEAKAGMVLLLPAAPILPTPLPT